MLDCLASHLILVFLPLPTLCLSCHSDGVLSFSFLVSLCPQKRPTMTDLLGGQTGDNELLVGGRVASDFIRLAVLQDLAETSSSCPLFETKLHLMISVLYTTPVNVCRSSFFGNSC